VLEAGRALDRTRSKGGMTSPRFRSATARGDQFPGRRRSLGLAPGVRI